MMGARLMDLNGALTRAASLLRAAAALTVALADAELPVIELPPTGAAISQAQLRAIAVLYLASELEAAQVVPATEDLMRLARSGGLRSDLGAASSLLQTFWLERNERATAEERVGVFSSLFGDQASGRGNAAFEDDLIDLCEALYKLDEQAQNAQWGGIAQQSRARAAARRLVATLSHSAGALTVFLAQDILGTIKQALEILGHPNVRAALGARSVGDVLTEIDQRLRRRRGSDFDLRVRRGQAGMTILAWLAEAEPLLESTSAPLVGIDHPVIPAAVDWLETSLTLTETTPTPPAGRADDPASSWDAVAS